MTGKKRQIDEKIDALDAMRQESQKGGGQDRIDQQHDKGKLTARERIQLLLDPGSFEEIDPFVTHRATDFGLADRKVLGDAVVTGYGQVEGRQVFAFAQDFTVMGGSLSEAVSQKICKVLDLAVKSGCPVVGLNDSGGARIQEGVDSLAAYGDIFLRNTMYSGVIPQISVIVGPAAGGAVYSPAITDFVFMVRGTGQMYITGPEVVKAATGEEVSAEDLGGGDVHTRLSGVVDYLAQNDTHALSIARDIVGHLNRDAKVIPNQITPRPPRYDAKELYGIIPTDKRKPFDIKEIIARIVDDSAFDEFKARFANTLICGFAHIEGMPVGIIANNGILFSESAQKGTHFIELCCKRKIPLVFLQNITGFMVGRKYENEGIARHGAKMVMAVANAKVPKFTVIVGGSFGAGNYGMCGRAYDPRFLWMWPNARISVMGGEQAASVLATVKRDNFERSGEAWSADDEEAFKAPIRDMYEEQGHPYYATARLWDDGVIDPADTRQVLALGLSAAHNAPIEETTFGIFRM